MLFSHVILFLLATEAMAAGKTCRWSLDIGDEPGRWKIVNT